MKSNRKFNKKEEIQIEAILKNINMIVYKVQKLYPILEFNIVRENKDLLNLYGILTGMIASLSTYWLLKEDEIDYYIFSPIDKSIISIFQEEINKARMSVIFLINKS